jgi:hypothetical protein
MLGVEAHSSLPYDQYDRGNLSGQSQARHLWPHTLGNQSRVELLEGARLAGSHGGRTLKQVLQIVIAVSVEAPNQDVLPGSLQLSVDLADRRCCASRWLNHRNSTTAAWCENDAASAGCPATPPPGSDQSRESHRAVSFRPAWDGRVFSACSPDIRFYGACFAIRFQAPESSQQAECHKSVMVFGSNRRRTNQNQSTRRPLKRLTRHNIIRSFQNGSKQHSEL